ncbi:winged helix-turn-helix transcriptional regulator [Hyphobacterium sp. CCMP332]|nr:winged helix-turn-helix transcriptional regulator [Hyphobacterium sp. CCMP332]
MGVSRTDLFDLEQNAIAQLARIFSHPARIAILQYLAESKTCINNDLVTHLGLAQPTVSQHLRELKLAGLIKGNIEGNSVYYCIDINNWKNAKSVFNQLFELINVDKDLC